MKQFQIAYQDGTSFREELKNIQQWCDTNPSHAVVFRIYSSSTELEHARSICDILDAEMPDALYLGCTSNANILEGALSRAETIVTCTVFEYASTRVSLKQIPFSEDGVRDGVRELCEFCEANAWVSAIEVLATRLGTPMKSFCDEMSALRSDIQVFGGGAANTNPSITLTAVFSKEAGFSNQGIVFLLLGGEDFHTYSMFISGWKPLTRSFKVTRSNGADLCELDGEPAYNVYQRYLRIENNESFTMNTLEFPFFLNYNGVDVLRCPLGSSDDGSLTLTAIVPDNAEVRLAYGNPGMILSSIRQDGQAIIDFRPEVIQVFSCLARRSFWGDENVSDETILFNGAAPTSGFYTGGEFLRINGFIYDFDITLVFAAMREGEPKAGEAVNIGDTRLDSIESEDRIPLVRRFVAFIEATTRELEEKNVKLALSSVTDGLTSLYNRAEIEKNINDALSSLGDGALSLIMLDIDNFKKVNDMYGHKEGDHVIIALADVLSSVMSGVPNAYSGRWGGEEFMVLLAGDIDEAAEYAEKIRAAFASVSYETAPCQTVSIGVCQAKPGETSDALCTRVDKALYTAKANGKNQVVRI